MYTIAQRGTDAIPPSRRREPAQSLAILRDYWGVGDEASEARRPQTIDRLEWLINQGDRADPQCAEPGDPEAPADLLAWDPGARGDDRAPRLFRRMSQRIEAWISADNRGQGAGELRFLARFRRPLPPRAHPLVDVLLDRFDDILAFLVDDPRSPWRSLPWRVRLDANNVRSAEADDTASRQSDFVFALCAAGPLRNRSAALFAVALIVVGWEAARLMRPAADRRGPGAGDCCFAAC